ncbi:MAG TPA: DUF1684 domain-containing protein [Xanthomonadaceae bacterium]|nr:DUF1684 domain-containing protein [Xanthomonadaceae bacterium]
MILSTLMLHAALAAAGPDAVAAHTAEVEDWRARRIARLTEPYGWLSLVGLHWLDGEGPWTLGSGADQDVVLAIGPDRLGTLRRDADGAFQLDLEAGVDARIGDSDARVARLSDGRDAPPTFVHVGDARMVLMRRGDLHALRVWDPESPVRTGFAGIDHYPVDIAWRFDAHWHAFPEPRAIEIVDVNGMVNPMRNPGRVEFEVDGRGFSLDAVHEEGDSQLFLILADRTSGRETYGAGRFLYTALPDDNDRVVVDFNRAYNPPCAFTEFSTCPLPPPQNRLDLPVTAGEKRYRGGAR